MTSGTQGTRRWFRPGVLVLALAAIVAATAVLWRYLADARAPRGLVLEPRPAPDFTLLAHTGEPYRLSEDQGRVRVLFFGYTDCPDVCPTTLGVFKRVHALLGDEAERVRFLMITVDPERDDQERLGEYVGRFHPDFYGLTGDPSTLRRVWADYGVYVNALPADPQRGAYAVEHSALSFIVDTNGVLRLAHGHGMSAEDMAHDIRLLLRGRL